MTASSFLYSSVSIFWVHTSSTFLKNIHEEANLTLYNSSSVKFTGLLEKTAFVASSSFGQAKSMADATGKTYESDRYVYWNANSPVSDLREILLATEAPLSWPWE